MPFSIAQAKWLETTQNKAVDFDKLIARQEARNAELAKMSGEISRLQEDLAKVSSELKVSIPQEKLFGIFDRADKVMDWKNGNMDKEVDTKHDLVGGFKADNKKVIELNKLHTDLIALQTQMEQAKDQDDKPLFDSADITRELWTPLVQADVIPSNAVADKYSQEAQVFAGACEIYNQKLEAFTEQSSKYEDAKHLIKIGGDIVTLFGSLAADAIKLDNLDALSIARADTLQLEIDKKAVTDGVATADQVANIEKIGALKEQGREAANMVASVNLSVTLMIGGLDMLDAALDLPGEKDKITGAVSFANVALTTMGKIAIASLDQYTANTAVTDTNKAFSSAFQTEMNVAKKSIEGAVSGGQAGLALLKAGVKFKEGDKDAGTASLKEAISGIAIAVGASFAAVDVKRGTDADGAMVLGDQAKWQILGGQIQGAIAGAANIPLLAKHLYDVAQSDGGKIDFKTVILGLGIPAMGGVLAGALPNIMAGTYTVAEAEKIAVGTIGATREKTQTENDIFNNDADAMIEIITASGVNLTPQAPIDNPEHALAMKKFMAERENLVKAKAMEAFQQTLKDPAARDKFFEEINVQTEKELEELNALLDAANQPPKDLDTIEKEQKAMAAMDKLLAEVRSCNMKWQALEMITSVGASVLAAALPGAGMAVAIQKLLIDATTLVRKSIELNKWMDNMELTVGNSSSYGAAISGRLHSARVQVSLQVLRVLYDSLGVAAESIKLADASGVSMGGGLAAGVGLQIGTSMARALTEFGYKMEKEAEIAAGWKLYLKALESAGDRKRARKAMKWNSTLSKCVIAYGIVIDKDPIAKEVARNCGITPEVVADQKNVCQKVVTYFETLYTDDPVVLKRIPLKKDWHPGTPVPTLKSWMRFKAAAADRADPLLAEASLKTPAIDGAFARLSALLGPDSDYFAKRDADFPEFSPQRDTPAYDAFLEEVSKLADDVAGALRSYKPVTAEPAKGDDWKGGLHHKDFAAISDSLIAQVQMIKGAALNDKQKHTVFKEQRADFLKSINAA